MIFIILIFVTMIDKNLKPYFFKIYLNFKHIIRMPQYNCEYLAECITKDSAILVGSYDHLTIKSRIQFQCKCGKEGNKNFKRATISGFYCDECTMARCKTKAIERSQSKSETNCYSMEMLETYLQRDKATLKCELPQLRKDSRITFICNCGNEGDKTFRYIKETGVFCKTCTFKYRSEKREKTNLERYGNTCTLQSDTIKQKAEETCMRKYGVKNAFQSEEIQNKIKETNVKKYGAENPFASKEIISKIRNTCLKRYATEFPMQIPELQEKVRQTNMERYNVPVTSQAECVKEKAKETNLIIYGHTHHSLPEILEKAKQTNLITYGVEYTFQAESVKEKIAKTLIERLGVDHNMKSESVREKAKATNMQKLGVPYALQSPVVRNKSKLTCLKKYNVENPTQSPEIQEKIQKTGKKFKTYTCPSGACRKIQGYEHFALDRLFLTEKLHEFDVYTDRKEVPRISYTDNSKQRYYFPDIWIKSQNKLIEVKSTWTYKLHKETNILKWKASREKGYACEFWIFTPKGSLTLITDPENP